jgi:DNA gyrase/topoisomerase IV subunit B
MVYNESSITHYEGLDQVRNKPAVFIGSIGQKGVFRLATEAFANILDEYTVGFGKRMDVKINSKLSEFTFTDYARGLPIGKFEEIFTQLFTSGKYDKEAGPYAFSIGTNGVGNKCINALSEYLYVDTYRDGKHIHGEFAKGKTLKITTDNEKSHHTGTTLRFRPDASVLLDISLNHELYRSCFEILAYMNPGLEINFTWDNKTECFLHLEGIKGYLIDKIIKVHHIKPVCPILSFSDKNNLEENISFEYLNDKGEISTASKRKLVKMEFDIHFTYGENVKSEILESYVNGTITVNNGTHTTGMHGALTDAFKRYITTHNLIPKSQKLEVDGNDIRESLVIIVNVKHSDPSYRTQIKEELDNKDIQFFIKSSLYRQLYQWLENHPKEAQEIAKLIIRSAKAKAAAREARENVIKSGTRITIVDVDSKKFNGCKSTNPEECELFIVEGDSAGGSAKDARDTRYQAVFRIRGKIQNTFQQKNTILSEELRNLGIAMGCGFGADFNIKKLRFHTIVKAVDADSDGYHISTLLDGFYFKDYRPIIESGYFYESRPPLYQIRIGKGKNEKSVFIPDERYFQKAIVAIATGLTEFLTIRGVKLSQGLMELYIQKIQGFKDFLDGYANQVNISPFLLEFIVRYFKDIMKKNFKGLEALGYYCTVIAENSSWMHINIDKDYEHYFIVLDNLFYTSIYKPVYKKLSSIYITDVKFKGKRTGSCYGGTTYLNAMFLDNMLLGSGVKVKRLKGLGESTPEELRYYLFNPQTRTINKLKLTDVSYAEEQFDIFLGNNREEKKKLFL